MAVARLSTVEKALRVLSAVAERPAHQRQRAGPRARARQERRPAHSRSRSDIEGWLQQDRRAGGWRLGPQSLVVGGRYAGALRDRAHPVLHDLAADTSETVTLWAVEGDSFTVVDAVESTQTLRGTIPIGYTASVTEGRDFLAFYDRVGRERLLTAAGLPAMSEDDAAAVRAAGYYVVDTSYASTIAVGAPVWDSRAIPAAAVLLIAPESRMGQPRLADMGARVRQAAIELSSGHRTRP